MVDEAAEITGVPLTKHPARNQLPKSALAASLAVMGANLPEERKGTRFTRSLLRRYSVEGENVTKDSALLKAAREDYNPEAKPNQALEPQIETRVRPFSRLLI